MSYLGRPDLFLAGVLHIDVKISLHARTNFAVKHPHLNWCSLYSQRRQPLSLGTVTDASPAHLALSFAYGIKLEHTAKMRLKSRLVDGMVWSWDSDVNEPYSRIVESSDVEQETH